MNRRDFVSRAVTALVAGSQVPGHKLLAAPADADEQWILTGEHIRASLRRDGTIRSMQVKNAGAWEDVEFCRGPFQGPRGQMFRCNAPQDRPWSSLGRPMVFTIPCATGLRETGWRSSLSLKNERRFRLYTESCPGWCWESIAKCSPIQSGIIATFPPCCAAKKHISGDIS